MGKVRVLHAADLHLDTAFDGLPDALAAGRRAELREIPERFAPWFLTAAPMVLRQLAKP